MKEPAPAPVYQPQSTKKKAVHTMESIPESPYSYANYRSQTYHQTKTEDFLEDLEQSQQESLDFDYYNEEDYDGGSTEIENDQLTQINETILDLTISQHQLKHDIREKINNLKIQEANIMKRRNSIETEKPTKNFPAAGGDTKNQNPSQKQRVVSNQSEIFKFRSEKEKCYSAIDEKLKRMKQLDLCLGTLYENRDQIKR
jgi:hypothetical protein